MSAILDCPVCRSGDIEHAHLLAVPEVAERRNAHPHTVRAAIKAGDLPAKRIGRTFVIAMADADAWVPRAPGRPPAPAAASPGPAAVERRAVGLDAVSPVAVEDFSFGICVLPCGHGGYHDTATREAPASLDAAQLADELLATGATFPVPVRGSNRDALIAFLAARLTLPGGQS